MRRRCVLEPVKCRYNPTNLRNPWRNLPEKIEAVVGDPVQFGEFVSEQIYYDRPGAYGIALGELDRIFVVAVGDLLALPGGALENDEISEEGLVREFKEETGYGVRILRYVGFAGQYVYASDEQTYYNKLCRFYQVELIGQQEQALDKDHHACWISVDEAIASLKEEAHRWAVTRVKER